MNSIKRIFENRPGQWGFRGDPFLWADLEQLFGNQIADLSADEFNKLLDSRFNEILIRDGKKISETTYRIEKYPKEGMSGSSISLVWWKDVGLPLLKSRYSDLKK